MWSFLNQISLTRYLFVCRVNRSMVRLPKGMSVQLSLALSDTITNRLPTAEVRLWRKALTPWAEYKGSPQSQTKNISSGKKKKGKKTSSIPEITWPVETILFVHPGKAFYSPGELILWELKLFGERGDHGFFLEVILPALEELGSSSNSPWYEQNSLWGRFDIQAVYAARGIQWEPVVSDGRLNLRYRATANQWSEGLTFGFDIKERFRNLTWLTPFNFVPSSNSLDSSNLPPIPKNIPSGELPTLHNLLETLIARVAQLLPGKYTTPDDVWSMMSTQEQLSLTSTLEQAKKSRNQSHTLKPAPPEWPGRWIGKQTFSTIPHSTIPYLELASILHLGRQTHFGCGTFILH